MKTKNILLSTVLTIVLTLPLFGQHNHGDTTMTGMKQHDMSKMMGKPTVNATVEGLHMKVWIMTQRQHKKMMKGNMGKMMMHHEMEDTMGHMSMSEMDDTSKGMGKDMMGMKHSGMGMNKAMMDSMMAGTHCIMLEVSDAAKKKGISDASVKVMIMSPSKKHSSVDLKPMMKHFGSGLTLEEKGKYQFLVTVNTNGESKTKEFRYTVR
jgi:hypothetical protein